MSSVPSGWPMKKPRVASWIEAHVGVFRHFTYSGEGAVLENRGTRIGFVPHLNGVSPFVSEKVRGPSSSPWIYRFNDALRAAIGTLASYRDELPSSFMPE